MGASPVQGSPRTGSPGPAVSVLLAASADIGPISAVLGRAFSTDPVFAWMLPGASTREPRARRVFRTMLRTEAMQHGGVEVARADGRAVGAAIWLPPRHWAPSASQQLRALPGYLRAFGGRLGSAAALLQSLARAHPSEPHWYLLAIGVVPELQGRGVAGTLLRSRLERCDRSGEPAYLEASNPTGIPLYQHFGFQSRPVPPLPAGAPPITPMWRPPAPVASNP